MSNLDKDMSSRYMGCKKYEDCCDNATICPCLLYEPCDNYCHSCCQNITETIDGLYYHKCRLEEKKE